MQRVVPAAFKVRLYRRTVAFTWLSTCDLKAKVRAEELVRVARKLGIDVNSSTINVGDLDVYNRLLIFAAVRPRLRDAGRVHELTWLVRNLNGWEASYWASAFREAWWAGDKRRGILRVARSFMTLFELM